MKLHRRQFLRLVAGAAALPARPRIAMGQPYPTRPVRIIIGFGAGGVGDIVARLIAERLSERMGQQFVIENRPGAGTNIATEAVANTAPDGYTLLFATSANAINATLYEKLSFNFIRDLAPVAGLFDAPLIMEVDTSFPARTVSEFIAYAKANPGKINFASGGVGSPPHVSGELLKMMAGINMIHVPYRGMPPALADVLGGQVQLIFTFMPESIEYIRTGRLRALGVSTASRLDALRDIPTVRESLPGFEATVMNGLCAPRNTPQAIIDALNLEINAVLADERIKARLDDWGLRALTGSPADFGRLILNDTEKWAKVVRFAGVKAN
jgi:tripartite-type tricarboxylate transporter receptor subunit TctC